MAVSADQIDAVLDEMLEGMGIAKALIKHGVKPGAFYNALESNHSWATAYAGAQKARSELLADEVVGISDDELCDPHRARNKMDARKWYASKMQPQKYGDRIDLNITERTDISGALADAKRRALPTRYPDILVEAQPVTPTEVSIVSTTDAQSVDAPKPGDADAIALAALLS